ncbi:MAG: NAD(P)-dependent oxidoreductase, partial [Bacteroidota bacterium]
LNLSRNFYENKVSKQLFNTLPKNIKKMKVTFIGLGIMGSRMAANLLKNGVDLTVFNRSEEAMNALAKQGAKTAPTAKAAAENADLVITMLSTPEVVASVMMEEGAVLSVMSPDAIWIDCSTVNPSFTQVAFSAAQAKAIHFVDAPVAGTKPQAENAELVFFVGGAHEMVEKVSPILNLMGKKVMYLGIVGKGASYKMLVNMMLAQSMIVFSEALLLGEKMGFDQELLLNTIPNLVVSAPFTKFKASMIQSEDYTVQFPLEWMHKDLHLATTTAYELGQPLFLANLAKELFAVAKKEGLGRLDFAAIHQSLANKT